MMIGRKIPAAFAAGLLLVALPVLASQEHCTNGNRATTPAGAFELLRDGTVIHRQTNLQWAQCALGQNWSRVSCEGRALAFDWDAASQALAELNSNGGLAGHTDWRLPTREELESIVEKCREAPSINGQIFPNTPWAGFWTTSTDTSNHDNAWFVGFYYGLPYEYSRSASYRIRPVRNR